MDEALWRAYYWVNGVQIGIPVRAKTRKSARRRAEKLIARALGDSLKLCSGFGGIYEADEESEEARCAD